MPSDSEPGGLAPVRISPHHVRQAAKPPQPAHHHGQHCARGTASPPRVSTTRVERATGYTEKICPLLSRRPAPPSAARPGKSWKTCSPGWANWPAPTPRRTSSIAQLLDESIRALSASGGAVWLRAAGGAIQPVAQINWPAAEFAARRCAHDARTKHCWPTQPSSGRMVAIPPQSTLDDADAGNPTDHMLLLAPVQVSVDSAERELRRDDAGDHRAADASRREPGHVSRLRAIPHGRLRVGGRLSRVSTSCGGCGKTTTTATNCSRLGTLVHRQLDLAETAYAVANEGRRVIGCDRLSVLVARRPTLPACWPPAASSRVERRSGAARRLEELAELVRRTDEPAYYADGQSDALPPIAEALERHAEESHARQIAAIPLRPPAEPDCR